VTKKFVDSGYFILALNDMFVRLVQIGFPAEASHRALLALLTLQAMTVYFIQIPN
jgi:hypothetical protein